MPRTSPRTTARLVLWVDAAFHALLAAACFALSGPAADWYGVHRAVILAVGGLSALLAGAGAVVALRETLVALRAVAFVSAALGLLLWALAPPSWPRFEPEGRWLAAAIANTLLLIAAAAHLARRRLEPL